MGYEDWYERIARPFRASGPKKAIGLIDRALVAIVAAAYVALLAMLAVTADPHLLKALAVPAATFALVSVARAAIDEPRPYEAHAITPLVQKDTRGKSMPSRHMSSAVAIACTFAWIWPASIAVGAIACCLIAFTRIVGGVHYPRDIAVATLVALACAFIGFVAIPW